MHEGMPDAIVLTRLTRRGNEDRRVVVQGFDVGYRTFLLVVVSAVPAAFAGIFTFLLIGRVSVFGFEIGFYGTALAVVLVAGSVYFVLSARTRAGLSYFKSLADWKRESRRIGVMHLGVNPISTAETPKMSVMPRGAIPVDELNRGALTDFLPAR
jgi:hypothetical protein